MNARARLSSLVPVSFKDPAWSLPSVAGRLVELSGAGASARLTAAMGLVLEAQRKDEPAAWITPRGASFFPPDAADGGIDLEALVVVRVADGIAAARAAEHLLRSGGFGLVVLDFVDLASGAKLPVAALSRLSALGQKHGTGVLFLTEKNADASSLASIVSLRVEARRETTTGCLRLTVLKDKRRGPGATHEEAVRGPAGLR